MGPPRTLSIAGSDSGGGAGIVADLKTFTAHGAWAMVAITAVTAQNTLGVQAYEPVAAGLVADQIESVAADIGVDAAKTGMLATADIVMSAAGALRRHAVPNVVVDPVFVSKHGDTLLAADAVKAIVDELIPLATLVTPNLPEAAGLAGLGAIDDEDGMQSAARLLAEQGARAVLVKGGHLRGDPADLLYRDGKEVWLRGPRIPGRHTHGTGCVLSAAICARLARGEDLEEAVRGAREYVRAGISGGLEIGGGVGPVNPPGHAG